MRNLFVLLLLILAPFAHAQNVEDAPLADEPAITPPAKTPVAPPATPRPTASRPTPTKTSAVQPTAAPSPVAAAPTARPSAQPTSTATPKPPGTAVEDQELQDELPPATTATQGAKSTEAPVPANKPAPVANDVVDSPPPDEVLAAPHLWNPAASFKPEFMQRALVAGLMVALLCGALGVFVVLRRVVFVGVALAELSAAGIALGLMLGFAPIAGALGFMAAGVVLFSLHWSPRRVPHESIIGVVYLLASALGMLLIAKSALGETHMLTLLQGNVLLTEAGTVKALAVAAAAIGAVHAVFGKEFVLVSFDREAAATLGLRAAAWELFLMGTIGLAIAFSIHATGVLLTASMLVLPAATALLWARSLRAAFVLAPLLAAVPVVLGLHLSFVADFPASAVIVMLSFLLFLAALVSRRGH